MKLISRELQSLVQQNNMVSMQGRQGHLNARMQQPRQNNLLIAYFKRRALGIIFTVVVIILLLTSSIFTDFGFNIGDMILSWFS